MENFSGTVMHSHSYRKPEDFSGKNVLILGAASSGIDIALDLVNHATRIYLSHNNERYFFSEFHYYANLQLTGWKIKNVQYIQVKQQFTIENNRGVRRGKNREGKNFSEGSELRHSGRIHVLYRISIQLSILGRKL